MRNKKFFFVIQFIILAFLAACSSSSTTPASECGGVGFTGQQVVVFSDVHFDPFYDSTLFNSLVNASADDWAGIFATSTVTAPSTWGHETNYPLLTKMLSSIKNNSSSDTVMLFTGDILRHRFASHFYSLYGSTNVTAMKAFADKTVAFFAKQVRANVGTIPVMFSIGNNDAYEDYDIEPSGDFLANTADSLYTYLLNSTGPEQDFLDTYTVGGYYSVEPIAGLVVIGLNSVYFSSDAKGEVDAAATAELAWLDNTLATAKAAGKKVWILLHIPPGANIFSTKNHIDSSGHIESATMWWEDTYQSTFLATIATYTDSITMMLAGHTHMDEYRLANFFVEVTPAISPYFDNSPSFKIFKYSADTFQPSNYTSFNYDVTSAPASFCSYYTFDSSYSMADILNTDLFTLYDELDTNTAKQARYKGYYYSGHDSASPITTLNWPVYWCGIGEMTEDEIISCVNGY